MEADTPSMNEDGKLPILDLKVWMDDEHNVVYEHYEKPMASKKVMNVQSAHSMTCKKSVHVQELLRRMLNTSSRLEWNESAAPVLTDYMQRMMKAGYSQGYRKNVLTHSFRIYDKMRREDEDGSRPIYRKPDWNREERRIDKAKKRYNWSTQGGYIAPIIVPATPNGELMKMLREVAELEKVDGMQFKILEKGGTRVKNILQKSNPLETPGCSDKQCLACSEERGKGGNCRRSNVNYSVGCQLCPQDNKSVYLGETSRNLYTRGKEHDDKLKKEAEDSFMHKHQANKHPGQPGMFTAKVTGTYNDCLTRQVAEGVFIRRCEHEVLNAKSEWHQPALWRIRSEVERV